MSHSGHKSKYTDMWTLDVDQKFASLTLDPGDQ